MKRAYKFITAAAISLPLSLSLDAQTFNSGYFLDNYVYGYRLNPAMHPTDSTNTIFGLLIGDITIAPQSNVGISSFLFPKDGELVWGLNEKVSESEFLDGLPAYSSADLNAELDLLTLGFVTKHGFFSFDARLKSNVTADASKDIFTYMKKGFGTTPGTVYNIESVSATTQHILEFAGDYSFSVKKFRFGVGLKFLIGGAQAQTTIDNINILIKDDKTAILNGNASISYATPLVKVGIGSDGRYDFNNVTRGPVGIGGLGGAIDLGVYWDTPLPGLSASFAVLDLGAMWWNNTLSGNATHVNTTYDISDKNVNTNDVINTLFKLDPSTGQGYVAQMLNTTFNLGLRYRMPFYERLSAGLHTSFITGSAKSYDARFGITVTPIDAISLAVDYGWNTYGGTFGVAANFRAGPVAIFGGIDGFITKFSPQGYPINAFNSVVKFGITIAPKTKAKNS